MSVMCDTFDVLTHMTQMILRFLRVSRVTAKHRQTDPAVLFGIQSTNVFLVMSQMPKYSSST